MLNSIGILGTGYVGLVTGACLASSKNNDVTCLDIDNQKIYDLHKGIIPIYEKGLNTLIGQNVEANRLFFDCDFIQKLDDFAIIFIAVGTPSADDGSVDLRYVESACNMIREACIEPKTIIMKSTVPVGTHWKVQTWVGDKHTVISNPEFLREGTAITDFTTGDRIVIGTSDGKPNEAMRDVYKDFEDKIIWMDNSSAEMVKYASNCLLATKLALWNEIAALCFKTGADIHEVRKGVGSDSRIGSHFLFAGPGYGGSCFPKDTYGMYHMMKEMMPESDYGNIIKAVIDSNKYHQGAAYKMFKAATRLYSHDSRNELKIAILGLAFKGGTDDTRESPVHTLLKQLDEDNYRYEIVVADPIATELPDLDCEVTVTKDYERAVRNADVVMVMTEWQQYRHVDLDFLKSLMRGDVIIDARNLWSRHECERRGFRYSGMGS